MKGRLLFPRKVLHRGIMGGDRGKYGREGGGDLQGVDSGSGSPVTTWGR